MLPTALSIAGLDPSGGAGLSADLRAFDATGVWGAAVCAALTVQSTRGLRAVHAVDTALVIDQAREVLADANVRAIKTGALGSIANMRAVARLLREHPDVPAVVDPVMAPSLGEGSLGGGDPSSKEGRDALDELLKSATVLTPNFPEASILLGREVDDDNASEAAIELVERGARAVLVKGGHGRGDYAVDQLVVRLDPGMRAEKIERKRRSGPSVHGTGCTLAALIAGRLAGRKPKKATTPLEILEAVRWARARFDRALAAPLVIGGGQRVLRLRGAATIAARRGLA